MFGIGGGELFFIIFIALMLFGSDKIPDIARALGKGMAQLKNATNEIKNEIQKGAEANGLDSSIKEIQSTFSVETDDVIKTIEDDRSSSIKDVKKIAEDIENMTGPIKRQL